MASVLSASWFYWAVGVAVGLPVLLVLLTEIQNALRRRNSYLARPVSVLRTFILPLGALLLLMTKARQEPGHETPVRIVATVFGFVVLVLLLSGLNATLFQGAPEGSWRKRIPSIFLDVARFVLIAVGLAMIFSVIWGANVGGLFTALGISSIVLGLALQNSVGQIISGLLMLFEQPFQLGDWLDTPAARGRVVEVNWRAVHIDTGSGLEITPNSVLAGASFTNLSRPPGAHKITVDSTFAASDSPDGVCALLVHVASALPQCRTGSQPVAVPLGNNDYRTSIPLRSPADGSSARATFARWLWYAARRAEYRLDGSDDEFSTDERKRLALRKIARTLRLTPADQRELVDQVRMYRYGADEVIQQPGTVPYSMKFVVAGQVELAATASDGSPVTVRRLDEGDFLGQTALTREPVTAGAVALTEVTVLEIDREIVEDLVSRKPLLVQDFGRAIEERRRDLQKALAEVQD
ncbi:MAG TPA: mechanosensitive ion channel family protein [Mycobacterium sp.]